jgi:hypothetical protein
MRLFGSLLWRLAAATVDLILAPFDRRLTICHLCGSLPWRLGAATVVRWGTLDGLAAVTPGC